MRPQPGEVQAGRSVPGHPLPSSPPPNQPGLAEAERPGRRSLPHPLALPSSRRLRPRPASGADGVQPAAQGGPSLSLGTGCASGCHVRQQTLGGPVGGGAAADPTRPERSIGPTRVGTRGPGVGSAVWRGPEKFGLFFSLRGVQPFTYSGRGAPWGDRIEGLASTVLSLRRLEEVTVF